MSDRPTAIDLINATVPRRHPLLALALLILLCSIGSWLGCKGSARLPGGIIDWDSCPPIPEDSSSAVEPADAPETPPAEG